MIVGSLLLIVVAVGMLVAGVLQGANALLIASIVASLLAAVALIVGGRQAAAARATARGASGGSRTTRSPRVEEPADLTEVRPGRRALEREPVGAGVGGSTYGGGYGARSDETSMMEPIRDEPYPPSIPQQHDSGYPPFEDAAYDDAASDDAAYDAAADDDDDFDEPEDEPAPQQTSPGDAARIAGMNTDVYVVDGRPRYHLRGCVHLMGRDNEPLPVSEAVELGFSPCGVCEPDSSILAAARRV
jgi:hypothetical protein